MISKHGEMEREWSVVKGKNVIGALARGSINSIPLPVLRYGSETWIKNMAQQSRVHAVGMSYLRCGITRLDG